MGLLHNVYTREKANGLHRVLQHAGFICFFVACSVAAAAQTNSLLEKGNKFYEQQKYDEAAKFYGDALKKDPNNTAGIFNMGNVMYQKKNFDNSRQLMGTVAKSAADKGKKSAAHYNIGNTYMTERKWDEAIDAYKNALRNNPADGDAKYNLAYAEAMKKKDGGGKDKQQKQDKKDQQQQQQQQQQKDGQDKKDQQQQQQQPQQGDPKEGDQDQKQQPQPSKLTQQQADNILNALHREEEKKAEDKMKKLKGTVSKLDKDW